MSEKDLRNPEKLDAPPSKHELYPRPQGPDPQQIAQALGSVALQSAGVTVENK